ARRDLRDDFARHGISGPTGLARRLDHEWYSEDYRLVMLRCRDRLYGLQLVYLFGALSADCRMAARNVWVIFAEDDADRHDACADRARCCCGTFARRPEPDQQTPASAGAKLAAIDRTCRPALVGGQRRRGRVCLSEIARND